MPRCSKPEYAREIGDRIIVKRLNQTQSVGERKETGYYQRRGVPMHPILSSALFLPCSKTLPCPVLPFHCHSPYLLNTPSYYFPLLVLVYIQSFNEIRVQMCSSFTELFLSITPPLFSVYLPMVPTVSCGHHLSRYYTLHETREFIRFPLYAPVPCKY